MKERRFDAAMDYWQRALRIQPDAEDLQLALATATYKAAKAREANGLPALDGAGVADAIRLLTDLLKKHADMTAAYFALGNIYANEHRNREAADEYQEVIRRIPPIRSRSARRSRRSSTRRHLPRRLRPLAITCAGNRTILRGTSCLARCTSN